MNKVGSPRLYILKIYNPIIGAVKTYKCDSSVMKIGSGTNCGLQITLPSLRQVHITTDFEEQKITAGGNGVHCDRAPVPQGTSAVFTNDSIVRIHNLLMIFLVVDTLEGLEVYDERIIQAASRFKEYSPVLRIEHNKDALGSSICDEGALKKSNGDLLDNLYDKELGEFSQIAPIGISNTDAYERDETLLATNTVLEKTRKEFEDIYKVEPSPEVLEAAIHKKLDDIKDEVHEVLEGDVDISLTKKHHTDLGEIAVENDLLVQAEQGIHSVHDADMNSLEQLKNSITDNIKEEIREEITQMMQVEAKINVEREVEECLQNPKFVEVLAKTIQMSPNMTKEDGIENDEIEELDETDKAKEDKTDKADKAKKAKADEVEETDKTDETKKVKEDNKTKRAKADDNVKKAKADDNVKKAKADETKAKKSKEDDEIVKTDKTKKAKADETKKAKTDETKKAKANKTDETKAKKAKGDNKTDETKVKEDDKAKKTKAGKIDETKAKADKAKDTKKNDAKKNDTKKDGTKKNDSKKDDAKKDDTKNAGKNKVADKAEDDAKKPDNVKRTKTDDKEIKSKKKAKDEEAKNKEPSNIKTKSSTAGVRKAAASASKKAKEDTVKSTRPVRKAAITKKK